MRTSRFLCCLVLTLAPALAQIRHPGFISFVTWPGKMYLFLNVVCDPARDQSDAVACLPSGGTTIGQEDGAVHWFVDTHNKSWFGYRLHVAPAGTSQFRLTIRPLTDAPSPDLTSYRPAPLPRYPEPFTVAEGDIVRLALLVNPATGRRITDEIQLFASEAEFNDAVSSIWTSEARDFNLRDVNLRIESGTLSRAGVVIGRMQGGSVSAHVIWFTEASLGRVIFSLAPGPGFQRAGTVSGRSIRFRLAGEEYEWKNAGAGPILPAGGVFNIYVRVEIDDRSGAPPGDLTWSGAGYIADALATH